MESETGAPLEKNGRRHEINLELVKLISLRESRKF